MEEWRRIHEYKWRIGGEIMNTSGGLEEKSLIQVEQWRRNHEYKWRNGGEFMNTSGKMEEN